MLQRILLGLDGSTTSSAAARWTAELAARSGATVTALCAVSPWLGFEFSLLPIDADGFAAATRKRMIEEWSQPLHAAGVTVEFEVVEDHPSVALLGRGEEADLIVVGRAGHADHWPHTLGGTTGRILRKTRRPVAVVPPPIAGRQADREVLVGFDGSPGAADAFRWACGYARELDLRVRVVRVVDVADDLRELVQEESVETQLHVAGLGLHALLADAPEGQIGISGSVVAGHVGSTLVDAAAESAALIVGSRGHSPVERVLLGSAGYYAAAHADCAVIVVPPSTGT